MEQNKTGKYFKYAIGEIVLVVIGILIALSINNWNEKRKLSNSIETIFTVFESELKYNIDESNSLIRYGYRRDSLTTLFVNNKITHDMVLSNEGRYMLGFDSNTRRFIDDNLDEVIGLEKQLSKKYALLIPELKELKRRIESQRKWEKEAIDIQMVRYKELTDEFPWWNLSDSISKEKRINHFLNDSLYKSKILHYNSYQLAENVWDATLIRTGSAVLLWKIKTVRSNVNISLEDFLISLGLKPFQELNCDKRPFEKIENISFRSSLIFYNNTNDTIYFNLLNPEGKILNRRPLKRAPKSFEVDEASINVNLLIEIIKNDTCNKVYRRIKEDYIIIN